MSLFFVYSVKKDWCFSVSRLSTVWFSAFPGRFVDACRWIMRVGPVFVEGKDQGTVVVLSRKSLS